MDRLVRVARIAVIALLCGIAAGANGTERVVILVGGVDKLIYLPAQLAESLGYFRDEGLDVELISRPSGIEGENQLLAGAAQGAVGFYDHAIDLQSKGKGVMAIVVLTLAPGSMELVRADLADSVRDMGDLRGRALGVTALGSSSALLGHYLAALKGATPDTYDTVPVGAGRSLIDAFRTRRVDVAWSTEPTTSTLVASGLAKVLVDLSDVDASTRELGGSYPSSALYVQRSWARSHPETATRMARAFVRALGALRTQRPEDLVERLPRAVVGEDRALYVAALRRTLPIYTADGRMPANGPANVLRVMNAVRSSVRVRHIDLSATYTNDFVDRASTP